MHGLILAGGDGSRLAASGVHAPKALVPVHGVPQIVRMIDACWRVGCDSVTCAVREDLVDEVRNVVDDARVQLISVREPTSLHTLAAGLAAVPSGNVLCTLVDTVMQADDWDTAHREAVHALRDASAVVAVTPLVEDEKPLWVDVENDMVLAFGRRGDRDLVTGGVYWFSEEARELAAASVKNGVQRLRGFLGALTDHGLRVRSVEVEKIVDIDTSADLAAALALIGGNE